MSSRQPISAEKAGFDQLWMLWIKASSAGKANGSTYLD
jgi:hypothetical protein